MRRNLPNPNEILEELADKAATQIDRLASVAFDSSLNELVRYHRFLLNINATNTPDGKPFNYAAIPGEALQAPHNQWINQYRRLFERAANRIGEDSDFIEKLAYLPLRLLPGPDDPPMSDAVAQAIVDLSVILIHQIEAWVTKRTVADNVAGAAANPRMSLAGSDEKSYANLVPNIVGSWESLLQSAPTIYRWRNNSEIPPEHRWELLRKSWPFVWKHLQNTAYMLAVSVWNEDELGAVLFRDALVRWPQSLRHHFPERAYFPHRRLLFPDILSAGFITAREYIARISPQHMPLLSPEELFHSTLIAAHEDVAFLTSSLLLLWSIEEKQLSDIGARTASTLLRRQLEGANEDAYDQLPKDRSFISLALDVARLEIAGDRYSNNAYASDLDNLVARLDNMTERRVVPGRLFTPSTLSDRDGLQVAQLSILLAATPPDNKLFVERILDIAKEDTALPRGDRSLRDLQQGLGSLLKLLETSPVSLKRGLTLLEPNADFETMATSVKSALTAAASAVETHRNQRLKDKPIDSAALDELRNAVEQAIMTSPGGVPYFRGFSIERFPKYGGSRFTVRHTGLNKAQFVNPPMEEPSVGFTEHFTNFATQRTGARVLQLFERRLRKTISIAARVEQPAFWKCIEELTRDVGPKPILVVSNQARGRILGFIRHDRDATLTAERKPPPHNGNFYAATISGIDVHGSSLSPGKAWLFSTHILSALQYASVSDDGHIVRINFQPDKDNELRGELVAEIDQTPIWANWPVYEIDCEDPEQA